MKFSVELTSRECCLLACCLRREHTRSEKRLSECHGWDIDRLATRVVDLEYMLRKVEMALNHVPVHS
jgi:hypothetical protein